MKFGENLKLIRKSKKISQEELAEKLGVSRQSVSKWETGENYPSINNILCLCDIFKCKINELVHEDFSDINSLDEDIKMSVVKFKEQEQKRMKGLSKLIYVVARIFKIFSIMGIFASTLLLIGLTITIPNTKINTKTQTVEVFNSSFRYEYKGKDISVKNDKLVEVDPSYKKTINSVAGKSKVINTIYSIILSSSLLFTCYSLYRLLGYLEMLFVNIHDKDTPFNSDNVNYIKNIALYLTLFIAVPDVLGLVSSLIFGIYTFVEIDLINYIFAALILSISYIFKYGYEIQLDSKGKIYGNIEKTEEN